MKSRRRWLRRCLVAGLATWQLAVGFAAISVVVIERRLDRVHLEFPPDQPGDTWIIAGVDSRAGPLPPEVRATVGSALEYPGRGADVVLVVHRTGNHTAMLSVPRDLLVEDGHGWFGRLTHTIAAGEQTLVDSLCHTLGIAADHLVLVDLDGFIQVVEAIGPIRISVDHPVRDPAAGLDIQEPGTHEVDSATALALVRSRHREVLIDGQWIELDDGAVHRAQWATTIFSQVASEVRASLRNPLQLARLSWVGSRSMTLDSDTRLIDMLNIVGPDVNTQTLATAAVDGTLARVVADESSEQLNRIVRGGCVGSP